MTKLIEIRDYFERMARQGSASWDLTEDIKQFASLKGVITPEQAAVAFLLDFDCDVCTEKLKKLTNSDAVRALYLEIADAINRLI